MNVDAWDDSKLVFKKVNMQGFDMFQQSLFNSAAGGTILNDNDGQNANLGGQKKGSADGN